MRMQSPKMTAGGDFIQRQNATTPNRATVPMTSTPRSRRGIPMRASSSHRASGVPSGTAEAAPTQRDLHLRCIAERGRMSWQRASGYNWRALVEADVSHWKRVIGDGLRFRTDGRQATEVAIAADVLNRMLDLDRKSVV